MATGEMKAVAAEEEPRRRWRRRLLEIFIVSGEEGGSFWLQKNGYFMAGIIGDYARHKSTSA
jgi:hypothetical protein